MYLYYLPSLLSVLSSQIAAVVSLLASERLLSNSRPEAKDHWYFYFYRTGILTILFRKCLYTILNSDLSFGQEISPVLKFQYTILFHIHNTSISFINPLPWTPLPLLQQLAEFLQKQAFVYPQNALQECIATSPQNLIKMFTLCAYSKQDKLL